MDEWAHRSAVELAGAIRSRKVSSRELLDLYLQRIERCNAALNAVVTLDVERARRRAEAADAALARGELRGPLHGVPVTVKDCFETAGLRTTCGVPELAEYVPASDAVAVARLREAGAILFGKTNTPPWASDWQSTNPVFGRTCNPWDLERTPGGSSGGSAAALAGGLTGLELGSDIGGSIRVPSHWSGVCGHKPSHGLVPQRGHLPGPPGTLSEADLNVVGPLARRVEDLELALDLLAGPLPDAARAWRLDLPPPRGRSLGELRAALWLEEPSCPIDAEMAGLIAAAVDALRAAGARVREARPEIDFGTCVRTYVELLMPLNTRTEEPGEFEELAAAAATLPASADGLLPRALRALVSSHRDWLRSDERRAVLRARWDDFFRQVDVLLCPVTLTPAIAHDDRPFLERTLRVNGAERAYLEQIAWPGLVTLALLPSTVIPVGRTALGLPVGMQIVGPFLEDRTPLAFARCAEEVLGGFEPPPESS